MQPSSSAALAMVQLGLLLGVVILGNAVAVRHLPAGACPTILLGRVELANRLRPWLAAVAVALTASGLLLHLA